MKGSVPTSARKCCSHEKQRLMAELDFCEISETTARGKYRCTRRAARESGMRAKSCLLE